MSESYSSRPQRESRRPERLTSDWDGPPARKKKSKKSEYDDGIDRREMCWYMENKGECKYGDKCRYRHKSDSQIAQEIAKARSKNFKQNESDSQIVCPWYQSSSGCRYGDRCRNLHIDPPPKEYGPSSWHLQGYYDRNPEAASHSRSANTDRQHDPKEKRWAPNGDCLSKKEFRDLFGGYDEWNWAAGSRCDHGWSNHRWGGGIRRKSTRRKSRRRKSRKRKDFKIKSLKKRSRKNN